MKKQILADTNNIYIITIISKVMVGMRGRLSELAAYDLTTHRANACRYSLNILVHDTSPHFTSSMSIRVFTSLQAMTFVER
jgi:hypothetical protein